MNERDVDLPYALDAVVTAAAVRLMAATASTSAQISQRVLADLVEHFDVDVSFLRYNDHALGASVLIAEWPSRPVVPDPDPLAVVYFADADPVFAQCENAKTPAVFRPRPATKDYQRLIASGSGVATSSTAAVPLVSGAITTGTLGFIKFGDRRWQREELNALQAIASLFAQVQARTVAEEQLRYLARHDELTGLHNRRVLLTHLSERLRQGEPVTVLFLDVDRLKSVNDGLGHAAGDDVLRAVAHRLRECLGSEDVVSRLGGDEFVASLVNPLSPTEISALTERIHACLAEPIHLECLTPTIGVSIGVSIGVLVAKGHDPRDPVQLLRDADTAMYAAKDAARGNTHYVMGVDTDQFSGDHRTHRRIGPTMIHQAIGILRSRSGSTTEQAMAALTQMSDTADTDITLIARHLVEEAVRRAQTVNPIVHI